MPLTLPRVVQRPTPNYTPVPVIPDLLVLHIMEGPYPGSVAWLCQRRSGASTKLCMSEPGDEVSQLLPLGMKSWGQCAFNGRVACDLELPGYTAQGIPRERYVAAATIFGRICLAYDIPPVWAPEGKGRGICQHHDLGPAGGGHHDCTDIGSPIWNDFIAMVAAARLEFLQMPSLPDFALHGLPNPHEVVLPPHATPTPSHGGASRVAPGDAGAFNHPTGSGFPHGSIADLQWRLRQVGANPELAEDGDEGKATRAAIGVFQRENGLPVAPIPDMTPATWAALYKATGA